MRIQDAKKYLPFVQAMAEGKEVEVKYKNCNEWEICSKNPFADWFDDIDLATEAEFRIKPEQKLREDGGTDLPRGISLRAWLTGQALSGICANPKASCVETNEEAALVSVNVADAVIKLLNKDDL